KLAASPDKLTKQARIILQLFLDEYNIEMIAQSVGVEIRQVWLIEQALKIRYKIPKNMSLHEALLLKEDP
ncbi:TPA: hypothetical protein ACH7I5_005045, partial [Escherichia coli]